MENCRVEITEVTPYEMELQGLKHDSGVIEAFRQITHEEGILNSSFTNKMYRVIKISEEEYGIATLMDNNDLDLVIRGRGMSADTCEKVFYGLHIAMNWDIIMQDMSYSTFFSVNSYETDEHDLSQLVLQSRILHELKRLIEEVNTKVNGETTLTKTS